NKVLQKKVFEEQILLAKELDLPIIVHDREAHEDTLAILKKHKPKGVLHCFSGSVETAKEVLKLGMYIGLGGAVTFKNAKKPVDVAAMLPLDRLLLETDCPYMAPVPMRGKRNNSAYIQYVAEKIGEIKGVDPQDVTDNATENTKKLFGI
ncbi:MAG: TatD family hydrolase, partial [Clostridia bacterium]|nr:TatD family hydrolase [Clostridia bacterium]